MTVATPTLSVRLQVFQTAVVSYGLLILNATVAVILARRFGIVGRGAIAKQLVIPSVLAGLAMAGFGDAIVFFASHSDAAEAAKRAASAATLLSLLVALSLGFGALLVGRLGLASYSAVPALCLPLASSLSLSFGRLRSEGRFLLWNMSRPIGTFCLILSAVVATSAEGFVRTYVLTLLAVATLCFPLAIRRWGWSRPNRQDVNRVCAYAWPGILAILPQTLNIRLDQIIITSVRSNRDIGAYIVAATYGALGVPASGALGQVLMPRVARGFIGRGTHTMVWMAVVVSFATSVALFFLAGVLIPRAFGPQYDSAIGLARVFSVAGIPLGVSAVSYDLLRGFGVPRIVMWSELCGAVVTAVTLPVGLHYLGLVGGALASLLAYSSSCCLSVWGLRTFGKKAQ